MSESPIEVLERSLLACGSRRSRSNGKDTTWRCPVDGHGKGLGDRHPSLKVTETPIGDVLVYCEAQCSNDQVCSSLGLKPIDLIAPKNRRARKRQSGGGGGPSRPRPEEPATSSNPKSSTGVGPNGNLTLAEYASAKQLPQEFLEKLGLAQVAYFKGPSVLIPYRLPDGTVGATRYRLHLEKGPESDDRFRWKKGDKALLYGLNRLNDARKAGELVLVEGESCSQTLWHQGFPALGIPGANNWKPEWTEHLDGIDRLFLVVEPDKAGEKLMEDVAASVGDRLHVIRLSGAKDASQLHCNRPKGFAKSFRAAMESAVPWAQLEAKRRAEQASEAWTRCADLALSPGILGRVEKDVAGLGAVGESRTIQLVFLIMVSRLLKKPVSCAVKGTSSSGKSFTCEQVLKLFPETAFYALTAMSEHALAYSQEPLKHRMLVVFEASGMQGEHASYLIRSLLSEGQLKYETVEKTSEGLEARLIEREGPTGLLVTTTAIRLHPENETRLLSVPTDDSPKQTRQILHALAGEDTRKPVDLEAWHGLSDWLEHGGSHEVVIPFAKQLADKVPTVAVRLRRDFGQVLTLIRAHALLHRASRKVDAQGRIVAELFDYAFVRKLVVDLIAAQLGAGVSKSVRQTREAVEKLLAAPGREHVSILELAKELELDRSAAQRRWKDAQPYIKSIDPPRRGREVKIILGEPLPGHLDVLPLARNLCTRANVTEGIDTPPSPSRSAASQSEPGVEAGTL